MNATQSENRWSFPVTAFRVISMVLPRDLGHTTFMKLFFHVFAAKQKLNQLSDPTKRLTFPSYGLR